MELCNTRETAFRLTVQLIRVGDGKHLWAHTFDEPAGDFFSLEDALSDSVSDNLSRRLAGTHRPPSRGTGDAEAHRLYLAARYHFLRGFRDRDAMRKALEYAGQAIARDPKYPQPYVIQSGAYSQLAFLATMPPREAMLKAKDAALRGVQLDTESAEAHASLAFIQLYYDFDLPARERSWRRAIELDPNNELALIAKSDYCLVVGRLDKSLDSRKRVQQLVPLEPLWVADVAHPLYDAGRYEKALVWTRRALDMDPKFPLANGDLSSILRSMGKHEESIEARLKWLSQNGADPRIIEGLRAAFDKGGIRGYDEKRLENALEQGRRGRPVAPLGMALLYAELGDKQQAVDWLEKAFEERDPSSDVHQNLSTLEGSSR
jgi:adenylate cyclase